MAFLKKDRVIFEFFNLVVLEWCRDSAAAAIELHHNISQHFLSGENHETHKRAH